MTEAEAEVGAAVELSGLPPNVPDELLTLYFENRRRSGGGPVLSWQRLGCGGVLTFQEPADAARVLAQEEHRLQGALLGLRPAPPRAPARLLLQGLPPDTTPQRLQQHVQALLCATGHPEQPCHVLASPRPDRALVQLPKLLSEAEVHVVEERARTLGLEGAAVSVAWVPQARAVRVLGGPSPVDLLLLELYLENAPRSGGGPLEGLRSLPGNLGTVISFRQWQAAERVLQQDHRLQGAELSLVPHYDFLEPEGLAEDTSERDHSSELGPGATEHALLEARGPARALKAAGTVVLGSEEAPGQSGTSLRTSPTGSLGQAGPVSSGPVGALGQEGLDSLGPMGSPGQEGLVESLGPVGSSGQEGLDSLGPVGSSGQEGLVESLGPVGSSGQEGLDSLGPVGSSGQEGLVESLGPVGSSGQEGLDSLGPVGSSGQEGLDSLGPMGSPGQEGLVESLGPVGSSGQEGLDSLGPMGSPGQEGLDSLGPVGSSGQEGLDSLGPVESPGQEGLVEMVLSMEPGAMRFIQLYHEDLLASLGDIALFPLEGSDVTGFRLCGALALCQAAEEFLQSLLGSMSCHMLSLKHPGSARFLLGPQGQHLLRGLEAQFRCVFGTERLARDALDTDRREVDPTEVLQELPGQPPSLWPPGCEQENLSLEEVRELLATLEGLDGEDCMPLELGEEVPEEQPGEEPVPRAGEEPMAPSTGTPGRLEEEAALQLALHQSLQPHGLLSEQEEAAALQQALALSLLEPTPLEAEERLGGAAGQAPLLVHVAFEQDIEELDQALGAALERQLREETVGLRGRVLPAELRARLEQCHGVSVSLCGDCAVLRGFGAQPARAARHLAALVAGPQDQSLALVLEDSSPTLPQRTLEEPLGRLECLAKSSREFQAVVQDFCDTLDPVHGRVRVVRVERVLHPLLQQQYELHLRRLEQRCDRRPVEHVLYHGTTAPAIADICAYGFNRSFCGRNGTLYGQGVYFAKRASLSVQDRYSPPNANGHKAVFVARVLTGDYGQGRRGLRVPPLRAAGHALLRYDSAVDCLQEPSIFVIFHDTQALPTHLITCEHTPQAPPGDPSGLWGHFPAT